MIFQFGKFKGQEISDVPLEYLKWVEENCTNISTGFREAVNAEIKIRGCEETRGREIESPTFKSFEEMIYDCVASWITQECSVSRMIVPQDKLEATRISLIRMLKAEVPIKLKLFRAQRKEK